MVNREEMKKTENIKPIGKKKGKKMMVFLTAGQLV